MRYIGFYWTYPVPWAGFTKLSRDIELARRESQSIAYQSERVRRWVKAEKGELIREEVFLEAEVDRGTSAIRDPALAALKRAEAKGARLVVVDFSTHFQWRSHAVLWGLLSEHPLVDTLDASPEVVNGAVFDPVAHFRTWQDLHEKQAAARVALRLAVGERARALRQAGSTWPQVAATLAAEGLKRADGRPWQAEALRKIVAEG